MQTGYPLTATMTGNRNIVTDGGVTPLPDRASAFNSSTLVSGKPGAWFDPTMFALPPAGQIGNAGRGDIIGPGTRSLNFSTSKSIKLHWLGEQGALNFRADFFNLFNHPLFGKPNTTVFASPSGQASVSTPPGAFLPIGTTVTVGGATKPSPYAAFGQAGLITSTNGSSRQLQLSLRLAF